MFIKLSEVSDIIMSQEGESFSMGVHRIFERENPTDNFIIKYSDEQDNICEKCGEELTKKHNCGDPIILTEEDVKAKIFGDFNVSGEGLILTIKFIGYDDDGLKIIKSK